MSKLDEIHNRIVELSWESPELFEALQEIGKDLKPHIHKDTLLQQGRSLIMNEIIKYEHHGKNMSVRADLKGQHWDYCLCKTCKFYVGGNNIEENCPIAQALYGFVRLANLVTPVWECEKFEPAE